MLAVTGSFFSCAVLADAGSATACRALGEMYENGEGGEADPEEAAAWFWRALNMTT